ncbi:MAG: MGMT family protein [Chloroflexota bacterium]
MADGFNRAVEGIVAAIPRGRVTTYGAIARALGSPRAARIVGGALARTRDDALPCHRVVDRDGRLSGGWAFGHPEVMRALLRDEGVPFVAEDRVDLARSFWDPAGG